MKINKYFSFTISEDRAKTEVLMRRTDTAAKLMKIPTLMELATKVSNLERNTMKMKEVCYM